MHRIFTTKSFKLSLDSRRRFQRFDVMWFKRVLWRTIPILRWWYLLLNTNLCTVFLLQKVLNWVLTVEGDSKDLMLCGLSGSYEGLSQYYRDDYLWYFGYFLRYWVCWVISISWCSFKRISIFCSGVERKA